VALPEGASFLGAEHLQSAISLIYAKNINTLGE